MTAIAGIWSFDGSPERAAVCSRMLDALADYGRDGCSIATAGDAAVGRCLSCILPEDRFDSQPVTGASGCMVVADARLDNRDELISALGFFAERSSRAADSAILAEVLEQWGTDGLNRVAGEFAFAFWNPREHRLILGRDPFGRRPLYFHRGRSFFAFAGMPSGLHAIPEVPCAPDLERIAHLLALAPSSRGFFEGIERVEPGHFVVVTREGEKRQRYWDPPRRYLRLKHSADYAEALREALEVSVKACLRGSGDVASHLSGGLDSSSVTLTAARLQQERGWSVAAFTSAPRAGYESRGKFADESLHAAAVAALYPNIDHVIVRGNRVSPLLDLDRNFIAYQKPLFNLCNSVWLHAIGDAVEQRGIRVLLTGAAGNATISYAGREAFAELLRKGSLRTWWREASAMTSRGYGGWRSVLGPTFAPFLPDRLLSLLDGGGFSDTFVPPAAAIRADLAHRFAALRRENNRLSADTWTHRIRWLRKEDSGNENKAMLARNGVERRDPTADRRLVEFCLSVPGEQYLQDGVPRSLLRRAMSGILPPIVLNERRKGWQAADWHEGLTLARSEITAELDRIEDCEAAASILAIDRLRRAVEDWPAEGEWERPDRVALYRSALLRGISAGHFVRSALAKQAGR